ncbi:MAG: hypothetical protein KatS3mg082_2240 [Nitrospiraceae bacterium]|nr:MAG: hypothetical protein KatS3mg082_2240 [Nitrospiraceae bacterium]
MLLPAGGRKVRTADNGAADLTLDRALPARETNEPVACRTTQYPGQGNGRNSMNSRFHWILRERAYASILGPCGISGPAFRQTGTRP